LKKYGDKGHQGRNMKIIILNRQDKVGLNIRLLKKVSAYAANKFDNSRKVELNIVFIDKKEMAVLNEKYRNKQGATDVLSFSYRESLSVEPACPGSADSGSFNSIESFSVAGEIVISPEVAKENVADFMPDFFRSWNLQREIALLIIHGILHIYDYDHEEKSDSVKMESLQASLLNDVITSFKL
jgi:probable rRNA maturation factor